MEEFKFEPQTMTVEQLTIHILRIFLQKKFGFKFLWNLHVKHLRYLHFFTASHE